MNNWWCMIAGYKFLNTIFRSHFYEQATFLWYIWMSHWRRDSSLCSTPFSYRNQSRKRRSDFERCLWLPGPSCFLILSPQSILNLSLGQICCLWALFYECLSMCSGKCLSLFFKCFLLTLKTKPPLKKYFVPVQSCYCLKAASHARCFWIRNSPNNKFCLFWFSTKVCCMSLK